MAVGYGDILLNVYHYQHAARRQLLPGTHSLSPCPAHSSRLHRLPLGVLLDSPLCSVVLCVRIYIHTHQSCLIVGHRGPLFLQYSPSSALYVGRGTFTRREQGWRPQAPTSPSWWRTTSGTPKRRRTPRTCLGRGSRRHGTRRSTAPSSAPHVAWPRTTWTPRRRAAPSCTTWCALDDLLVNPRALWACGQGFPRVGFSWGWLHMYAWLSVRSRLRWRTGSKVESSTAAVSWACLVCMTRLRRIESVCSHRTRQRKAVGDPS
jgi:hypothetical protein